MKTLEWNTVDKSTWPRGPWDSEPDKKQWQDEATQLPCLVVRAYLGNLCGYVGVPEGHPAFGKGYDDLRQFGGDYIEVHGGLTFGDACHEATPDKWERMRQQFPKWEEEARRYPRGDAAQRLAEWGPCRDDYQAYAERMRAVAICHVPEPGEPKRWWFGFDCAHLGDLSPGMTAFRREHGFSDDGEVYRDLPYVEGECRWLATQLAALARA